MDKPWKAILAFIGVFIAGAVFGGVFSLRSAGKRMPGPPPTRPQGQMMPPGNPQIAPAMMRQLAQRLKLTEEQREKVRPIVSRAEEDLQRLRRQNFQDTNRVMERMHVDLAVVLTAEQRTELEQMKDNMRLRLKNAEGKDRRSEFSRGIQAQSAPRPADATASDDRSGIKGN